MHKLKNLLLCLLSATLLMTFNTKAEVYMTNAEYGMTGTTTVRLVIPSAYIVEIPATVSIPYGAESTPMSIGVSSMELGSKTVKIALNSAQGNLLQRNGQGKIPYVLLHEGVEFNSIHYTSAGQTLLNIAIALRDWYSAEAGEYTSTVTFHVSVEDQGVSQ